jgi:hypothetical protein
MVRSGIEVHPTLRHHETMTGPGNATDTFKAPRALTVLDIVKIVLPDGTRGTGDWGEVCRWAPDLFAVVASITERSGLYSQQIFTAYWSPGFVLKDQWIEDVRKSDANGRIRTSRRNASGLFGRL